MKTETRKRIESYKEHLPDLKKRIFAAVMMLVIASTMVISSTFAWVTLSSAPEVSSISTTIAANGSLEIALQHGHENELPSSGRGTSYAAQGNNMVGANITWGNLVNLSDESYGLQKLELRPARLNTANLLNNPLWGAVYGADGRVMTLNTDYTFATFDKDNDKFLVNDDKGVRAISSYTMVTTNEQVAATRAAIDRMKQPVLNAINAVSTQYANNVMTTENIEGLRSLLGAYVNGAIADVINGFLDPASTGGAAAATDITPYVTQVYQLYDAFYRAVLLQKDVYAALANFQSYVNWLQEGGDYVETTWEEIAAESSKYDASTSTGAIKLTGLSNYITLLNGVTDDQATLRTYSENSQTGTTYTYSQISNIVFNLAQPNEVTVNGTKVDELSSNIGALGGLLNGARLVLAKGYLKDFEQIAVQSASRMNVFMDFQIDTSNINLPTEEEIENLESDDQTKLKAIVSLLGEVSKTGIQNASVKTAASNSSYTEKDTAAASNQTLKLDGETLGAEDTYGLAIDLWLRTNDSGSYLVLQGSPETTVEEVTVQGTDGNGNAVDLYTATVIDGENTEKTGIDVYKKNDKYYYNKTNTEAVIKEGTTPEVKKEQLTTVTGYNGVNRVWSEEDKPLLTQDSTTQGNGSCFTFYADTAEDHARFLRVLKAMNIAFIDDEGNLLAMAVMDTDNSYSDSGKVTVPVVIRDVTMKPDSDEELTDANGEKVYGIMPMQKNVSYALTAIVYLNGDDLGNDDVLSASSITGQLNLQFATTPAVKAADNAILENQTRSATASISGLTEFDYDGDPHNVTVSVKVEGDNPTKVEAAFQRVVNDSQGKRMDVVAFTKSNADENTWIGTFPFTDPGTYKLREVMFDGMSYTLANTQTVTVNGFSITGVTWNETGSTAYVYSAENSYSEPMTISLGASSYNQKNVRLLFMKSDGSGSISVSMTQDGETWKGTAVFGSSGTYVLSYAVIDGLEYDLSSFRKEITLSLGLSANITTSSSTKDYFSSEASYSKKMSVQILDNSGAAIENLENVSLVYSRGGSSSDTVTAQLTYKSASKRYEGDLPLVNTGSYSFLRLTVGSSTITKANENAPVFYLRESTPVSYDTNSVSTFHGNDNVQFSNNAYIGPIRIANSQTAYISAVVHNSITNEDYPITQATGSMTEKGTMCYSANAWYIYLPEYRDSENEMSQDGVWTVKSITLWDVVDGEGNIRDSENKLTWTDGDGFDFGALSTKVSSTLIVNMTPGTTNLGSNTTPFMTSYLFSDLGAYVALTDNSGYVIPNDGISSIELLLSYEDNKDPSYGYTVSGNNRQIKVKFNTYDSENQRFVVSDETDHLQYVGEYNVVSLTVKTVYGRTVVLNPGESGVPVKYTVKSAAPNTDNVTLMVTQRQTVYGKNNDGEVEGTFLQAYVPSIEVKPTIQYKDANNVLQPAKYADFDGIDGATVTLQYKSSQGKRAANVPDDKSYTWTGTSAYETVTLELVAGEGGAYVNSTSTPLLAGDYEIASVYVTMGDNHDTLTGDALGNVSDVEVYSKSPTVTMSNPVSHMGSGSSTYFETNRNAGTANNTAASYSYHLTTNELSADGYEVTLRFITRFESESSWRAASPRIDMTLSNISSNFTNASVSVPNDDAVFTFTNSDPDVIIYKNDNVVYIGDIGGLQTASGNALTVNYIGDQTINTVSVTDLTGTVYSVQLSHNLVIHENPEPNAQLATHTVTVSNDELNGDKVTLLIKDAAGTTLYNSASAGSFTVNEGDSLTITSTLTDEVNYKDPEWSVSPMSNVYDKDETTIKIVKGNLTIEKRCYEAESTGPVETHWFGINIQDTGSTSAVYQGGKFKISYLDSNTNQYVNILDYNFATSTATYTSNGLVSHSVVGTVNADNSNYDSTEAALTSTSGKIGASTITNYKNAPLVGIWLPKDTIIKVEFIGTSANPLKFKKYLSKKGYAPALQFTQLSTTTSGSGYGYDAVSGWGFANNSAYQTDTTHLNNSGKLGILDGKCTTSADVVSYTETFTHYIQIQSYDVIIRPYYGNPTVDMSTNMLSSSSSNPTKLINE